MTLEAADRWRKVLSDHSARDRRRRFTVVLFALGGALLSGQDADLGLVTLLVAHAAFVRRDLH